jgi:hypothetical protein
MKKITIYKFSNNRIKANFLLAYYADGELDEIKNIRLLGTKASQIIQKIPFLEKELVVEDFDTEVTAVLLPTYTIEAKVALFCTHYEANMGGKYKVLTGEASTLQAINPTDKMFDIYFKNKEWWHKQPKSIKNFYTHFNDIQALLRKETTNQKTGNDANYRHPADWTKEYERSFEPSELSKLFAYYRKLGWEAVKSPVGDTLKWQLKKSS